MGYRMLIVGDSVLMTVADERARARILGASLAEEPSYGSEGAHWDFRLDLR